MFEKKNPHLEDHLPIDREKETGILIKWRRIEGMFDVYFEGLPLHISSFEALNDALRACMKAFVNDEGWIVPTLSPEEAEKTEHQMPIHSYEQDEDGVWIDEEEEDDEVVKEDGDVRDDKPSWLKN